MSVVLNISVLLPEPLGEGVREVNREISRRLGSEIVFTGPGATIPHLTLLMGLVPAGSEAALLEAVERWCASSSAPRRIALTHTYMVDSRFVFVGVEPEEPIRRGRHDLAREVGPHLTPSEHGGPGNPTHLTLAHLPHDLDEPPPGPVVPGRHEVREIGIGLVGRHGTVTRLLHRVPVRG